MSEPTPPAAPDARAASQRGASILQFFNAYLATLVVLASLVMCLFFVPQTAAIMAQTRLRDDFGYAPQATVLRGVLAATFAVGFLFLFALVFPPDPKLKSPAPEAKLWSYLHGRAVRFHTLAQGRGSTVGGEFLKRISGWSKTQQRLVGALVASVGLLGYLRLGPVGNRIGPYDVDYASAWPGILAMGFGWWIAFVPNTHGGDPDKVSWGWRVWMRAFLAIAAAWVVGEALWLLPALSNGAFTTKAYTAWGVDFLMFLAAVSGRAIDAIDLRSRWPLRAVIGGVILVSMGTVDTDKVYHAATPSPASEQAAIDDAWYDHFQTRLDGLKGDGPAVLVAASGGGSRAALFASLTYEALQTVPMDHSDPASPTFGEHIVAISSVSGGSLASGYYLHAIATEGKLPRRPAWLRSDLSALTNAMRSESARLVGRARQRFGESALTKHFEGVDEELANWPATPLSEAPWLRESAFADDMTTDFMAAVLRASIEPGLSRGGSITRLWNQRFGLGQISSAPGEVLNAPAVLFDATEVQSGRRFVIGFPRMPRNLLGHSAGNLADVEGLQWVNGAEAVRLSANFPWGFEVAGLAPQLGIPQVELLDGGIVDNTGIDTFTVLFEHLELEAGEGGVYPKDSTPERQERARKLLDTLRKRGVLLVEIDAGARPDDTAGLAALLPAFTSPLQALSAASSNNAFEARDQNVNRIRDVVDRGADRSHFLHLTWVCNRLDNVQTAWSLGTSDKAVTILQFLAEQRRMAPLLARVESERKSPGSEGDLQSDIDDDNSAIRVFQVAAASSDEVEPSLTEVVSGKMTEIGNIKAGYTGTTASGAPPPPAHGAVPVSLPPPPPPIPTTEEVLDQLEALAAADPDAKTALDALRRSAKAHPEVKQAISAVQGMADETKGILPAAAGVVPKDLALPPDVKLPKGVKAPAGVKVPAGVSAGVDLPPAAGLFDSITGASKKDKDKAKKDKKDAKDKKGK